MSKSEISKADIAEQHVDYKRILPRCFENLESRNDTDISKPIGYSRRDELDNEKDTSESKEREDVKSENTEDTGKQESTESNRKEVNDSKNEGLTESEKEKIKEETGWSDEIIDAIRSMEEYEIYKKANLHEEEINGRKCLVKDIDMDYVDPKTGKTNRELMEDGKPPYDAETGEKIELHHLGQNSDGPFVELCENSEHGDGNHKVLHPKVEDSWRNDSAQNNHYKNVEKPQHWKTRAKEAQ